MGLLAIGGEATRRRPAPDVAVAASDVDPLPPPPTDDAPAPSADPSAPASAPAPAPTPPPAALDPDEALEERPPPGGDGAGAAGADGAGAGAALSKATDLLAMYVRWIPTEVIAAYVAATTILRGGLADGSPATAVTPHAGVLFGACIGAAVVLTALAGLNKRVVAHAAEMPSWVEIGVRTFIAVPAFLLWSLTAPGSWWLRYSWDATAITALAIVGSIVFAAVAEILVTVAGGVHRAQTA
jgi:hypothetical protein